MTQWRTEIKDRFYRTYAYLPVDRVPDMPAKNDCEYLEKKRKLIGKH